MPTAVAFLDDLMFVSRIREAAKGAPVEVKTCRKADALVAACREGAAIVFVDLDSARLPTSEALGALQAEPALAAIPVVGFVSHVDAARARWAREAGVSRVLARSAFVQELPMLLASLSA